VNQLDALRAQLDALDDELLSLLQRRAAVVRAAWAWKQANQVPQKDEGREASMRARLLARAQALGLDVERVQAVLATVIGQRF
jgi:chorismate mutase